MQWHYFDEDDLEAVGRVLEMGQLGAVPGVEVPAFEEEFCQEFGAEHALAVVNAMAGLHCAVVASGARPGDEIIVDPMVVFGALSVLYHRCVPVFCDVERDTHLMDASLLPSLITSRTRAVIVTHLWGQCADMEAINAVARENGLMVIEDCAHSIYASCNGRYAGTLGDIGVFSFQQSKQMSLGDGGMTVMKTPEAKRIMQEMISFGTVPRRLGWNYRMNEVVAAIGRVQLTRVGEYVTMCQEAASLYNDVVSDCEWLVPQALRPHRTHTYHIWTAIFEGEEHDISIEEFEDALAEADVELDVGYIGRPAYAHSCVANELHDWPRCEVAEYLMPRLVMANTGGDPQSHVENAEKLAEVIAQF